MLHLSLRIHNKKNIGCDVCRPYQGCKDAFICSAVKPVDIYELPASEIYKRKLVILKRKLQTYLLQVMKTKMLDYSKVVDNFSCLLLKSNQHCPDLSKDHEYRSHQLVFNVINFMMFSNI